MAIPLRAPCTRHPRPRRIPAVCALSLDLLLIGAVLIAFALVHHALPQRLPTAVPVVAGESAVTVVSHRMQSLSRFTLPDASAAGATLKTASVYESADIQVTLSTHRVSGSDCQVLDIYIGSVENLKTAFAKGAYGKGVRAHPIDMAKENHAVCAINGDYYGISSESGAVIRNGELYRDNPASDVLVLYYDGTMRVVARDAFDGKAALAAGAYQAWCFGPSLLDDAGAAQTSFVTDKRIGRSNPRTVIGYYAPGHYCFFTVDGRSDASRGMTLTELSAFSESLGLTLAYNLDGGQTSVMTFGGRIVNTPYQGGRESSDIIYIGETGGTL